MNLPDLGSCRLVPQLCESPGLLRYGNLNHVGQCQSCQYFNGPDKMSEFTELAWLWTYGPFKRSLESLASVASTELAAFFISIYHTICCYILVTSMLYYTILHDTILYYTILYYTILYYTILYYPILYYTTLDYSIRHYTILYYTILYYTILYYTILYYTILYCTILYYTILYYTILYYTILYFSIL